MADKTVELFTEILSSDKLGSYQNLHLLNLNADDPGFVWQQLFYNPAYAMLTYDDMEEKDGIVSACLETRRNGLLSKPRHILPASDAAEDKKIAEFVEETLFEYMNFDAFLEEAYEAVPKGLSVGEKIFADGGDRIYIEKVNFHPQHYFTFGTGEYAEYSSLMVYRQTGPLRLRAGVTIDNWINELLPEDKFFVFSYRPRYGNRWGTPLDRKCYWASWMKRASAKQWLRYLEKGTGSVIARYNDGATKDEMGKALDAATAVVEESAVAMPKKFLLEVHEMVRSIGSSHKEFVDDYCKYELAQIILGQTLTTRGSDGGGSRALGQVHQGVQDDRVETDARSLMAAINARDGLVHNLVFHNFGPNKKRPKFVIEYEIKEDIDARAKRYAVVHKDIGLDLSIQQIREDLQIEEPNNEQDTLAAAVTAKDAAGSGDPLNMPAFSESAEKKKIVPPFDTPSNSRTERFMRQRPSMIEFSDE